MAEKCEFQSCTNDATLKVFTATDPKRPRVSLRCETHEAERAQGSIVMRPPPAHPED